MSEPGTRLKEKGGKKDRRRLWVGCREKKEKKKKTLARAVTVFKERKVPPDYLMWSKRKKKGRKPAHRPRRGRGGGEEGHGDLASI